MSDKNLNTLDDVNLKDIGNRPNLLVGTQSYIQETSTNLNLLDQQS